MVDYFGPCKAVGLIDTDPACSGVKCPRKMPENCRFGLIPTGACCPICGGVLKIVFSRKQIDRGIYALKNTDLETLTLKSILKSIQQLIEVSSCYLSGFLTFETDLMLIVYPSDDQIEVCQQEAMKIANLISTKSHHFSSNLGLSSFVMASYVKPTFSSSTTASGTHPIRILILSLVVTFQLTVMP